MKYWYQLVCLLVCLLIISANLVAGCGQKETSKKETAAPSQKEVSKPKSTVEPDVKVEIPDASEGLQLGFKPGDTATDATLKDPEGVETSLFQLLENKPLMIQFGSYT